MAAAAAHPSDFREPTRGRRTARRIARRPSRPLPGRERSHAVSGRVPVRRQPRPPRARPRGVSRARALLH